MIKISTGFTLLELTLSMAIFALAVCGILSLLIPCATFTESAGNITSMLDRAREELENTILTYNFDNLDDYSVVFPQPLAPRLKDREMSLVCYVQDHNSVFCPDPAPRPVNLKELRIVISYRDKYNRIIGEDRNLNGVHNGGEDRDNDGRLTSPCEIVTFIRRKD